MASLLEEQSYLIPRPVETGLAAPRRSWLLDYLPAMYAGDEFLNRFLFIFEDTLRPIQQMADNLAYYFHPMTAPREMVDWLATWVCMVMEESWSLEQRRLLIYSAPDLYSRRGTRRGLIEYLTLYTGVEPDVSEYVDGMLLGPETHLGINTTIAGAERHSFTVTLRLEGLSEEELAYKEAYIRRIIETEKPAHTTYRLRLITGNEEKTSSKGRRAKPNGHRPGLDGEGSDLNQDLTKTVMPSGQNQKPASQVRQEGPAEPGDKQPGE